MANLTRSQNNFLKDNFLETLGGGKEGLGNMTEVEAVMFTAANRFMNLARKQVERKGKVDKGNMSNMDVSTVNFQNGSYSITIGYEKSNPASKYYDYQNKGVQGIKSHSPKSIYKYDTLWASKKMIEALMDWYLRHKSYIQNEDQRRNLSKNQSKSLKVGKAADPKKRLYYIAKKTAERIKERGMPRVGFFDDNIDKVFNEDFRKKLAIAIGEDIVINIRQYFDGNNGSK